ncbi:MAG: CRISPR-associated protein Csm3 [Thermosipho sp. (in: thermotogales)]|nr:CRISPR-associated protein Csm3 [Thermosipho sp. (in: thermotogales)]
MINEVNFIGKFIVSSEIVLKTGLQIGTEENSLEIGGIDNPVIKDAFGRPYIPGSSLKGKMRMLMEFYHGKVKKELLVSMKKKSNENDNESVRIHMCNEPDCVVCNLFGRTHVVVKEKNESINLLPTRLIVRDAYLIESSITDEMKKFLETDYTEVKHENNIDRITSMANPRINERVPAGAKFGSEFIVNVFENDQVKFLKELLIAMKILEDDYLGGNGSRGYGKIQFQNIKIHFRDKKYYQEFGNTLENDYESEVRPFENLNQIDFENIKEMFKRGSE